MEMAKPEQKLANLKDLLGRMNKQMSLALPSHMKAERMARIALTACLKTPKLLDCDIQSFAGAMLVLSALGLEPDGNEAHLVPFNNRRRNVMEVQVIPDYKGLAKLARQSGEIKVLDWREVRAGDVFKYEHGSKAYIQHVPSDEPIHAKDSEGRWVEKRPITHCYALAVLDSGETVFEAMRWDDIEWHRDCYSKSAGDGPWVTNPDAMGAKTCFRKLSKRLPRSTALMRAVELDEKAEQAIPQDLGAVFTGEPPDGSATKEPVTEEARPRSKLDEVTQALRESRGPAATPGKVNEERAEERKGKPAAEVLAGRAGAAPAPPQTDLGDF